MELSLQANAGLASQGVTPNGKRFIVTPDEAQKLGLGTIPGLEKHIRPYCNGHDIAAKSRDLVIIIDRYGLSEEDVKTKYSAIYEHISQKVRPSRDSSRELALRDNWWIFERLRGEFRPQLASLKRYIVTPQTAQRKYFTFMDGSIISDSKRTVVASDDAYILGILSSRIRQRL